MAEAPQTPYRQAGTGQHRRLAWPLLAGALLVCLAVLPASSTAQAQISTTEEYRLKLAFLYNFAKFVEWPADAFPGPQAPLNICIVGRDPFDRELEQQVGERTLNGHPYVTRRLRARDDLTACHIVFLPATSDGSLPAILKQAGNSGALIMGESAGFARRGGTVNFVIEGTRLRFEVNLEASQRARSRISSHLLALARIVKPQQP